MRSTRSKGSKKSKGSTRFTASIGSTRSIQVYLLSLRSIFRDTKHFFCSETSEWSLQKLTFK